MKRGKKRRSSGSRGTKGFLILLVVCLTGLIAVLLIPEGERRDGTPVLGKQEKPEKGPVAAAPGRTGPAPAGERNPGGKRVAILIDDIGYDPEALKRLLAIEAPLAFSVLPHTPHARSSAEAIHRAGREVLLHLPMEPHGFPERDPGRGALFSSMTDQEIRRILLEDLRSVPHARGVNNHMGSKFMEARNPVRVAFGVMRERGLYFVDSLTSEASVAREMASEMTLRFAQRDQFVDDAEDRSRAAVHLANLLETRDSRSDLLLIAHPYPETVSALADAIPRFPAAGIRIVRLSELVNGRQGPPGDRPNRNRNQTP